MNISRLQEINKDLATIEQQIDDLYEQRDEAIGHSHNAYSKIQLKINLLLDERDNLLRTRNHITDPAFVWKEQPYNSGMKDTIRVDGKLFQKSRLFGNWRAKTVHKNKKAYNRQKFKNQD